MKINNIVVKSDGHTNEISADISGYRIWYRVPSEFQISPFGDLFLAASFFPAMVAGRELEIDTSVSISTKLVYGIERLQDVFRHWSPALKKFKIVGNLNQSSSCNEGVASFFSGGIDGLSTLLKNRAEITHLVFINGFDFQMSPEEFERAIKRNRKMVSRFGKSLIPVETNHFSFMRHHKIDRLLNFGSCLASVALLLGFSKMYIPASHTYTDPVISGSHPAIDHFWSTEGVQLIHDGAEWNRTEKFAQLMHFNEIMDALVVCWYQPEENCGRCGKCVRTLITLELFGMRPKAFPKPLRTMDILKIRIDAGAYFSVFSDILNHAVRERRWGVAVVLIIAIWKNKVKLKLIRADKHYLRGLIKGLYSKIRYGVWRTYSEEEGADLVRFAEK